MHASFASGAGARRRSVNTIWATVVLLQALSVRAGADAESQRWQPVVDAARTFMTDAGATSATVAISRGDTLLFEQALGFCDAARTVPTRSDTVMRIASVSKPFTGVVIKKLIAAGKLGYDSKAIDVLKLAPFGGRLGDPRLGSITIRHLLEHKGGWDRGQWGDPMFMTARIRGEMKLARDPTAGEIVQWMLGKPLQFEPGSASVYSNFGYCMLGRVVEAVTGGTYEQQVRAQIIEPLRMQHTFLSRSRAADRDSREVWYPVRDTEFCIEAMDSHGGWACSAGDLCRFMNRNWIGGDPRKTERYNYVFFGSLPGTTAMALQRPDGLNVAALFNNRSNAGSTERLKQLINSAVDAVVGGSR